MNFIITVLYEIALWLVALLAMPKLLYHYFVQKKYRKSLLDRLSFKLPSFQQGTAPLIWIHAVSVGETKAIVSLAREIKRRVPFSSLVISSTTETGHAEAKRSLPFADHHIYLPFDFNGVVKRILKQISPKLVILCESDFWYNFLRLSKKQGASVVLVNGKISEKSADRFSKFPTFSKRLFNLFDLLCIQNTPYQKRLTLAEAPPQKMVVTGNLKLDDDYPQLSAAEVTKWRQKLGIKSDQLVLTIGSSHHPEEQLLIKVLNEVWQKIPSLKVIIVPRHPERFKTVQSLLEKENISVINFTNIATRKGEEQVILIDAMGMLRMCYQLSDVALVAGSFTSKVGGHNILEPCWYGKPVLFGPYMHSQQELVEIMHQYQAGMQISEGELQATLERFLTDTEQRQRVGQKGLQLVQDLKGSTRRTMEALEPLLSKLEKGKN